MSRLSDEQLLEIYWKPHSTVEADSPLIRGLRAVAEAAVKDATSDWCVSDSVMAGRIMNVFGRSHDPSLEPAADPFRDKIAAMIYQHRTAVKNAVRYTSYGALAECPCCGSLDVGGAHDTVHCYKCGLSMKRPPPLQNAADAWNRRTRPQASAAVPDAESELLKAAKDFYNKTIGDKTVRISTPDGLKRDQVTAASERLRSVLLAASQPEVKS